MKGHGAKLPRKQQAAISALMSYRTMDEAAKAIGVSTSTLRRWMDLPDFREAYLKARRQAVTQSYARLQQNSGAACTVLLKMMADPAVKPWARIQAARSVLEFSTQSLETDDMLVRLERLEKTQEQRREPGDKTWEGK